MIRRAAAVVLALMLSPAMLNAQDTVITVNAPWANIHKGPSNVTPILGQVSRGTVLPISQNLGSWVKIPWPTAPDGVGYVHVTMVRVGPPPTAGAPGTNMAPRASSASAPATTTMPPVAGTSAPEPVALRRRVNLTPASHIFGVGGLAASTSSFGATARAWRNNRLGIQLGFTRDVMTSAVAAGRMTSTQVEPGVVFALFDHVSDYVWIRPYVGSAVSFRRQALSITAPVDAYDNGVGFRVFGGGEVTFAALPRFGLSADAGYRRFPTLFPGFEADSLSVSIAGHWYIK